MLGVFDQMCQAVEHMHTQKPPIIHRDLKVENFLLAKGGVIKLCDFGSATTTTYEPDYSWTAIQVSKYYYNQRGRGNNMNWRGNSFNDQKGRGQNIKWKFSKIAGGFPEKRGGKVAKIAGERSP